MPQKLISKKEFSELVGVSKPAITKAVKADRLGMVGLKVNLDHKKTKEYIRGRNEKNKPTAPVKKPAKKKTGPKVGSKNSRPTKADPLGLDIAALNIDDGYTLPKGINSLEDVTIHNIHLLDKGLIDKIKSFETALKAKQDRESKRGELVKREIVKQVFAKIHTVDTNQWKTLDDKIIPSLCGLFNVQDGSPEAIKARKMVSDEVAKILRYVRRITDEFFESQEVENG